MTNPSDMVRVRARLDGRASVYEANGWCQSFNTGVLSGNGVLPNTVADMNVLVGGTPDNPDVVIAQNPDGYKIALDLVSQQAVAITAPASQSRISAIVAYTDDLSIQSTDANTTGSPSSCGLIVVNGNTAANPTAPNDTTIRSAITSDGATGSQACYSILALITVSSSATAITSTNIAGQKATLAGTGVVSATNIDFSTMDDYSTTEKACGVWHDGKTLYQKTYVINNPTINATTDYAHGLSNYSEGFIDTMFVLATNGASRSCNCFISTTQFSVAQINDTNISYRIPIAEWGWGATIKSLIVRVKYTKTS